MNKLRSFLSIFSFILFGLMLYFAFKDLERIKEIFLSSNKLYLALSIAFFLHSIFLLFISINTFMPLFH